MCSCEPACIHVMMNANMRTGSVGIYASARRTYKQAITDAFAYVCKLRVVRLRLNPTPTTPTVTACLCSAAEAEGMGVAKSALFHCLPATGQWSIPICM